MRNIGRLSRAGTKLASFTVAGAVRQRLAETGFEVTKQPGFGHKRHMLVAEMKAGRQALPATEQRAPIEDTPRILPLRLPWTSASALGAPVSVPKP